MIEEHPNLSLLSKLNILDLDNAAELFADNFVWHYFNPNLPDIEGDYVGIEGLKEFFNKIKVKTNGSFRVEPVTATPVGKELVVIHAKDFLSIDGKSMVIDVVVVWRIVKDQFVEAWDIPSAFTMAGAAPD